VVSVDVPVTPGFACVPYTNVEYDTDLTSPLLTISMFGDAKIWTPKGYPLTRATGALPVRAFFGARRSLRIIVTNGAAFDAQVSVSFGLLNMSDIFYDNTYRILIDAAAQSMVDLAAKWGGRSGN
jgi:hypothetical protein